MKRIALTFSLVLLITVANGQSKFGVRPHFLGLSIYTPDKTFQIGVINYTKRDLYIKTYPNTTFQLGLFNSTKQDCFYSKIIQFGIFNFATGKKGIQMGILNVSRIGSFGNGRPGVWSPPQQRYRWLYNRKLFCR